MLEGPETGERTERTDGLFDGSGEHSIFANLLPSFGTAWCDPGVPTTSRTVVGARTRVRGPLEVVVVVEQLVGSEGSIEQGRVAIVASVQTRVGSVAVPI